ncbi:MAG: histidine phosphatase family protein [bacterium]|nr:histidine phosphatase family protein [bacterium]
MKVYIVRHGQTEEHAKQRRQTPDSRLSREGEKQVEGVARRLSGEEVDLILSSKWPRASRTAEIIAKKIGKPLEFLDYIHETEEHPDLGGVKWGSAIDKQYEKDSLKNLNNLDWKFRGRGESLKEVNKRAMKFKKHLEKAHLGQNLVVVTHGNFIRSLVSLCILGEKFDKNSFVRLWLSFHFTNTGISLLEYKEEERRWSIRYLNEHAHLG